MLESLVIKNLLKFLENLKSRRDFLSHDEPFLFKFFFGEASSLMQRL